MENPEKDEKDLKDVENVKKIFSTDPIDTLVISGGGIKGFNILGALQCAFDTGILNKDILVNYVGTSVGAIICYLLTIGYTPIEILLSFYEHKWLDRMQNFNIVSLFNGNGATSFNGIQECLEKMTLLKIGKFLTLKGLFEMTGKNLCCITYNISQGRTEYISHTEFPDIPCLVALRMSSNIPLIFDRFKYMNNYYLDGGISENFPILYGEKIGTFVLGIYLNINKESLKDTPSDGIANYLIRIIQIPIIESTEKAIEKATKKSIIVPIFSGNVKSPIDFDIRSKDRLDMFGMGYSIMNKILKNNN